VEDDRRVKEASFLQLAKGLAEKGETIFKLLPCPECGCAPTAAGDNTIKCGNPECMLSESQFSVGTWNNEVRSSAQTLKREIQRAKPLRTKVSMPTCKVVEAVEKLEPDADIEWWLRVAEIVAEDDE